MAIAIGLLIGVSAMVLTLVMGPEHSGVNPVSEQNLGVQFERSWANNHGHAIGVFKLLGVPIWDNGQGLGSRMPNLMTQQGQSPFIFLGEKFPVEYIVFLRNLSSMLLALVVLNLTILSWSDWRIYRRIIFLNVAILGPHFLFTTRLDWFVNSDQYWALCLIFAGFFHPSWYQDEYEKSDLTYSPLIFFAFIFGLGNLLTGQPLYFQIALVSFAVFFIHNFLKIKKILGPIAIATIFILFLVLLIPEILELSDQVWSTKSVDHSSQPSIFDFSLARHIWVYQFQPITAYLSAAFQPLLRLFNKAGPRTEFFNLLLIPYILFRFVGDKKIVPATRRVVKTTIGAAGFIFLCMVLFGSIARSNLPVISKLVDFHIWQLSHSLLLTITILTTIFFGVYREVKGSSRNLRFVTSIILPFALVMAVLYPIVMTTVQTSFEKVVNSENSLKENSSEFSITSLGLEKKFRSIYMTLGVVEKLHPDRHLLELQRAGFPSIDSVIYGRSSGTLRTTEQKFRSVFTPSSADCQAKVLDFLAINAIVSEYSESSDCRTELSTYFGSETERSIKSSSGDDVAFVNKPKVFSSWSIAGDSSSNQLESCPMFEKDCLSGLTITKLETESRAPFELCESKCLFTYKWAVPTSSKQVLVPENYDKAIEVIDRATGAKLSTANYQGLLAVSIPSGVTGGVFEALINPDAMMWARVSATYIHTLILILTLILISVRGLRGRKRLALAEAERIDKSSSQISH